MSGAHLATLRRAIGAVVLMVACGVLAMPAAAQAPFPAGRPLSGSIVCRIQTTSGTAYTETQTHTWTLTGAAPQVSNGDLWIHLAQWSVTGSGRRDQQSATFIQHEEWTVAGGPLDAPIAIRSSGSNLTVELYHTPAQVSDGTAGATTSIGGGFNSAPSPWREPAREAPLPPIQGPRLAASLTGSTSVTITGRFPVHRQPAGTDVVESCTWQIAPAGGQSSLPPPPNSPAPQQTAPVDATGRRGANAASPAEPVSGPPTVTVNALPLEATLANGPWSGQAQCVLTATAPGYQDEQTHTWRITGGPPKPNGIFRQWPAVWSVKGKGTRGGETWTIDVPETPAPIAIWELAGGSRIRIGSQHGLIVSNQGLNVSGSASARGPFKATLEEWTFPVREDVATNATISGTSTRRVPQGRGWRQPVGVETTEICTWNFTRGATTTPDLSSSTRPRDDVATIAAPAGSAGAVLAPAPAPPSSPAPASPAPASIPTRPAGSIPLPGDGIGPAGTATLTTVQCTTTGPQATTTVTPGGVTFKWPALQGASGYSISRRDIGVLTTAPITALTYTHAAPLDYHNAPYQYSITASYPDGRCATRDVAVTAPRPITPTVTPSFTGSLTARVTLKWPGQSDTPSSYVVLGPGLHQNGVEVTAAASGQTFDIDNVPAGPQTWLVMPVWKTTAGNLSDAATAARVTVTIRFTTGNYRISLAGFRVNRPTYDDQLNLDGLGDEVYAAATVSQWRRQLNSVLVLNDTVKSEVYRGLTTGGVAPSGFDPSQAPGGAGSKTRFPLVLWEGVLSNDVDVVVVHPTLWELDGDPEVFNHWKGNTSGGAASNYFWFKDMYNGTAIFEHKYDYPTDIYQFSTAAQFANEQEPFSSNSTRPQRIYPGRDRPIGLDDYSESVDLAVLNYSKIYWDDREYTFTRNKIEALLNAPSAGLAPGMVAVRLVDGDPHHVAGRLDGDYTLYFYVQRIP